MNFSFCLDEFRPTKPEKSLKKTFDFLFFPLSLSLRLKKNQQMRDISLKISLVSFYTSNTWLKSHHVSLLFRFVFCPKTFYFILVQVQIILYKLSLNYYPTFKIFSKISFLGFTKYPSSQKFENYDYLGIRRNSFG